MQFALRSASFGYVAKLGTDIMCCLAYLLSQPKLKHPKSKIIQTQPNPVKGKSRGVKTLQKLPGCHRPPWPRWHGALETSLLFNCQGFLRLAIAVHRVNLMHFVKQADL